MTFCQVDVPFVLPSTARVNRRPSSMRTVTKRSARRMLSSTEQNVSRLLTGAPARGAVPGRPGSVIWRRGFRQRRQQIGTRYLVQRPWLRLGWHGDRAGDALAGQFRRTRRRGPPSLWRTLSSGAPGRTGSFTTMESDTTTPSSPGRWPWVSGLRRPARWIPSPSARSSIESHGDNFDQEFAVDQSTTDSRCVCIRDDRGQRNYRDWSGCLRSVQAVPAAAGVSGRWW